MLHDAGLDHHPHILIVKQIPTRVYNIVENLLHLKHIVWPDV